MKNKHAEVYSLFNLSIDQVLEVNHAVRLGADDELVGVEVEHVSHLADDDTRRLARLDAEHRAVAVGDDGRQAPVVPLRRSQAVLLPCRPTF